MAELFNMALQAILQYHWLKGFDFLQYGGSYSCYVGIKQVQKKIKRVKI